MLLMSMYIICAIHKIHSFFTIIQRYKHHYSKRTNVYSVVPILQPKKCIYIAELVVAVFEKRKATPGHVTQKLNLAANDPQQIATNIALEPRPSKEELLV